jgi:hypothetical protein
MAPGLIDTDSSPIELALRLTDMWLSFPPAKPPAAEARVRPRPEQCGLLLRPADEQHPLGSGEAGQELMSHIVLTLPLGEVHPRNLMVAGEGPHRGGERLADRCQRRRGGHRHPQMLMDVTDQPSRVLQLRHIDVEVHPVDALDLEQNMVGQDLSNRTR